MALFRVCLVWSVIFSYFPKRDLIKEKKKEKADFCKMDLMVGFEVLPSTITIPVLCVPATVLRIITYDA